MHDSTSRTHLTRVAEFAARYTRGRRRQVHRWPLRRERREQSTRDADVVAARPRSQASQGPRSARPGCRTAR